MTPLLYLDPQIRLLRLEVLTDAVEELERWQKKKPTSSDYGITWLRHQIIGDEFILPGNRAFKNRLFEQVNSAIRRVCRIRKNALTIKPNSSKGEEIKYLRIWARQPHRFVKPPPSLLKQKWPLPDLDLFYP